MKQLITIMTPEIAPHCVELKANHSEYAKTNRYEYRVVVDRAWPKLHPSFSKVFEIHSALEAGCEYVLWADADVAFMDHSVDLKDLLINDYFMAAYHQTNWPNWVYLCAGLTVWRNTPEARRFVANWKSRCESGYIEHTPYEQWYLDELVRESNYAGIRCCSAHEIGCFAPEIWHDGTIWKEGMPTVHLAGPATWERRREVFIDKYAPLVKR